MIGGRGAEVGTPTPASVADAVASHVSWLSALATLPGGATWTDGPISWAYDAPYATLHALFPDETPPDVVGRGLDRARADGAAHVVVWSAYDVERPHLTAAGLGFEVGWQPWWMGAATADFDDADVRLSRRALRSSRVGARETARAPLLERGDVWRVQARTPEARAAGRAWGHLTASPGGAGGASVPGGAVAGLYDMAVREPLRRQGYGRDLLSVVAAEAARRGADRITANATPEGSELYAACGFVPLGRGRTWWWHAPR